MPLGVRTSLTLENKISRVKTANVAGLLPGSDPKLKDEVVVYSAHHDHLGIGEPDKAGDKIYNGAHDNAVGLRAGAGHRARLGGAARAAAPLGADAVRRGAKSRGCWAPSTTRCIRPFAPGKIAANINYDGGNISAARSDLTQIGMGKSSLDAIAKALAAKQGREVVPDQFPDRGFFYRSDQFNFAKIGVPALYFDTGTDFIGKPAGWGKQQIEEWEASTLPPAERRARPTTGTSTA